MISLCDSSLSVPCATTVGREVNKMCAEHEIKIKDNIRVIPDMVSLTTDAWSLRFYKGYLAITMLWVDRDWCLQNVLLDFVRFPTPHNEDTTSSTFFDLLAHRDLLGKVRTATTNNASYMCAAMLKLTKALNTRNNTSPLFI